MHVQKTSELFAIVNWWHRLLNWYPVVRTVKVEQSRDRHPILTACTLCKSLSNKIFMFQFFHYWESDVFVDTFAKHVEYGAVLNLKVVSESSNEMNCMQLVGCQISFIWLGHLWDLVAFEGIATLVHSVLHQNRWRFGAGRWYGKQGLQAGIPCGWFYIFLFN